jgi:hypothetical protein
MRSSSAWSIVAATLVLESSRNCDARKWFDVADATIYLRSAVDPGRIEYSLERDPFDFRPQSTAEPTIEPQENDNSPTASPSLAPTAVESDSPTSQPSPRYMFVVGNGGCNTGRSLFEIRMVDSWGDGWGARMNITEMAQADEEDNSGDLLVLEGEASASISQSVYQQSSSGAKASKLVFSGGLYRGDEGYKYVCLDALKCYSVEISAGTWTGMMYDAIALSGERLTVKPKSLTVSTLLLLQNLCR